MRSMSDGNTTCPAVDECDVCGRCTMCHPCDPRYDHGDPLPAGQARVIISGDTIEEKLRALQHAREQLDAVTAAFNETVARGLDVFIHQPDEYHATHYPDGVLHTFTGPNHDGHTRTWHVTTRHPEGTNHEQL